MRVIDDIYALFGRHGALRYGESTTQLQHALQCAELARIAGSSDALVAAALLHDIGQFLDDAGNAAEMRGADARHEVTGAAFLSRAFAPAVTEPVRLHVDAKRYLVAHEPGYAAGLSRASAISLALQGGAMNADEVAVFVASPWFADAVALRRFDDAGKRAGWIVPGLESHRTRLETLLV